MTDEEASQNILIMAAQAADIDLKAGEVSEIEGQGTLPQSTSCPTLSQNVHSTDVVPDENNVNVIPKRSWRIPKLKTRDEVPESNERKKKEDDEKKSNERKKKEDDEKKANERKKKEDDEKKANERKKMTKRRQTKERRRRGKEGLRKREERRHG